jgi:hypothetical protein
MKPKKLVLGIIFAGAFALAMTTIIGQAWIETSQGRGAETYKNVYGMPIQWVTVLVLCAALFLAFIVGVIVRWWQRRDDRAIDEIGRRRK